MKIFLSWSGGSSREFAHKFHDFIGHVMPWSEVYISDDEIESGERWLDNISTALEGSSYGIIFLTNENKVAPWVLFEAGALSKRISESRVVPLLCDIDDIDLTGNPLSQFQYRKLSKIDVERLVKDLNSKSDVVVNWDKLSKTFEKFWPDYEPDFKALQKESAEKQKDSARSGSSRSRSAGKVDIDQLHESLNEILRAVRVTARTAGHTPLSDGKISYPNDRHILFSPENTKIIDFGHDIYVGEYDGFMDRARLVNRHDGSVKVRYSSGLNLSEDGWISRFNRSIKRIESQISDSDV